MAIYGAPPGTTGYPLNLRLACRSNLTEFYRSDSTFLERLHWEGAVDLAPEHVAKTAEARRIVSASCRSAPSRVIASNVSHAGNAQEARTPPTMLEIRRC